MKVYCNIYTLAPKLSSRFPRATFPSCTPNRSAGALVELSEEHGRLFPILIAPPRKLGQAKTDAKGGFSILVTTPLQSERLNLFVNGRTYNLAGANVMTKRAQADDSVYTMRVRVPGPNVIRVRRGFIPGPAKVTVEKLPRF